MTTITATIAPHFVCLLKTLNWYSSRNMVYTTEKFDNWKVSHEAAYTGIKAVITDFAFDTLVRDIDRYFIYLTANNIVFDTHAKYFVTNFDRTEWCVEDEKFQAWRTKECPPETYSVAALVSQTGKMNLNVSVNIES